MTHDHYYALIMAGGGGTRLWPMSRTRTPKQLLPLVEEQSMFRISVERLAPLFPPERIYIVAGRDHQHALMQEAPKIPASNFVIEPAGRDSGPAAALGIRLIHKRDPEAVVALLTADHHISDAEGFRAALETALAPAAEGNIVTLGISPSLPSTSFGYIHRGELLGREGGFRRYECLGFTEKPSVERAIAFLKSGEYVWNSGMFIWSVKRALGEFERQQPAIFGLLKDLEDAAEPPDFDAILENVWARMPRIQLDYAVMEHADRMQVIPVDIGWSDVGSWDALFDVLHLDPDGNGLKGHAPDHVLLDTQDTLIYSDKLAVAIGCKDLIIVDTNDVLMVCHRDHTQDVKKVVSILKDRNRQAYL